MTLKRRGGYVLSLDLGTGFTNILFYIAAGLEVLLIILLIILLMKTHPLLLKRRKAMNALESKGMVILDKLSDEVVEKKSFFRIYNKNLSLEKELRLMFKRLDDITEKQGQFKKEHETMITSNVERLYKKMCESKGKPKEKVKSKKEKPPKITLIEDETSKGLSEDVKKVLTMTDDLMEKLPDDIIEKFTKSEDFKLYKKVIKEAKK